VIKVISVAMGTHYNIPHYATVSSLLSGSADLQQSGT